MLRKSIGAALSIGVGLALSTSAAAQGGIYQEEGRLVVVEIESSPAVDQWVVESDRPGFTYRSFYRWGGNDQFNAPGAAILPYEIEIHEPGNYLFAIHNRHDHPDDTEENDTWVRMDGGTWYKCFSNGPGTVATWNWDSRFDIGGQPHANWNLSQGVHLLEFSARSRNFMMDRFHLYQQGHPDGNNTQAPESVALLGDPFCPPNPTSTSSGAELSAWGSAFADKQDLTLVATELPAQQYGYFLASRTQMPATTPNGSSGNLCLGGSQARFNRDILFSGASGTFELVVDTAQIPTNPPSRILAGETWSFQGWFRDQNPGLTSNFTRGVVVVFQ